MDRVFPSIGPTTAIGNKSWRRNRASKSRRYCVTCRHTTPKAAQETHVVVRPLKFKADSLDNWRVAKKIKPSQRGAIKLARVYGSELLCVRYRENPEGTERMTTVELVVERAVIQKRNDPMVWFKLKPDELALRQVAMSRGARYNGRTHMWQLPRSEVLRLGLKGRIAVTEQELQQEQVHP